MKIQMAALATLAALTLAAPARATTIYDGNVTPDFGGDVIFGTGNANGSFTIDQSNGVELGLRGKLRHNASGLPENAFNSNGDGSYTFPAGVAPTQAYPTAVWSWEWSINSNFDGTSAYMLDDLTYKLELDSDPGVGSTDFTSSTFDPINDVNPGAGSVFWDHSIGNNSTTSATDSVATDATNYATLIASNNAAQNSWKAHWYIPGFNPTIAGEYTIKLSAFDGANPLASTLINIEVVPEPATMGLAAVGLVGLLAVYRRRRRTA
jgi:hypothetical protein